MARINSGVVVATLTAAALATIGALAVQASGNAPAAAGKASPSAATSTSPGATASSDALNVPPVPKNSGTGHRVVYRLSDKRVWLVNVGEGLSRTFTVAPSSVGPAPGAYQVTWRTRQTTGTDGVPIEYVVGFTSVDGTPIGFSAAVDGSSPSLQMGKRAGGIRERHADGAALWTFAPMGTRVVVVV